MRRAAMAPGIVALFCLPVLAHDVPAAPSPAVVLNFAGASLLSLGSSVEMCPGACLLGQSGSRAPTQRGYIRGELHGKDNRVLPTGIAVVLVRGGGEIVAQTRTDSSGRFEFNQLEASVYRIVVRSDGYRELQSDEVNLVLRSMVVLSLELTPDLGSQEARGSGAPGGVVSVESLLAPASARKNLAAGKALLDKGGDLDRSIELFRKAAEAYPRYSEAYLMMGVAYRALHKLQDAEVALRKCIELNPSSPQAYVALGDIQNETRDYAAAEKTLLKALALNPDSPFAHEELARTYWATGRWQDADPHAARAVALLPTRASARLILGNIELRKRHAEAALHEFQEYLRLEPGGALAPSVRQLVAKIESALAQSQSSAAAVQPAPPANPEFPNVPEEPNSAAGH